MHVVYVVGAFKLWPKYIIEDDEPRVASNFPNLPPVPNSSFHLSPGKLGKKTTTLTPKTACAHTHTHIRQIIQIITAFVYRFEPR